MSHSKFVYQLLKLRFPVRHQQSSLIDEFQVYYERKDGFLQKSFELRQLLAEVNKQMIAAA